MKLTIRNTFVGLLLFAVIFSACSDEQTRNAPDVSHIEVRPVIKRFEVDLFAIDTNQTDGELSWLRREYPEFAPIYFDQILGLNDPNIATKGPAVYLNGFLQDALFRQLMDTTQIVYPDFAEKEKEFTEALRYFKYYFPDRDIPDIVTFISEFSFKNFVFGENAVAVGLDFYLGETYPYLQYHPNNPNFSAYLSRHFTPEYLVPGTLYAYLDDLVGPPGGARLLDYMIANGKKRYLLERLLPYESPEVIFEYDATELDWIQNNERDFWGYLVEKDLLYSTDYQSFRKLVEYSPTGNTDMPRDSPGRMANYLGYRIVQQYMRRHPATSSEELLTLRDAQKLLEGSRYKP